jgi:NTP pyrophosphatase (non-canonical NTP hydrolase)
MTFQEIVNSIGSLSTEERDCLFDLIRQQRIEEQEAETLANYRELQQAIKDGTAKKGSVQDLIADLLGDDDENCLE